MDGWHAGAVHWGCNGAHGLGLSHRKGGSRCASVRSCSMRSMAWLSLFCSAPISLCNAARLLRCTVVHPSESCCPGGNLGFLPRWLGLPCALPGREDLVEFMAAEFLSPRPEPPGRFPKWSAKGLGPG